MYGHDSSPSRIFSYDVIDKKMYHQVGDQCEQQRVCIPQVKYCENALWMSSRFYNELVACRQEELNLISQRRLEIFPELAVIQSESDELQEKIDEIFKNIKSGNIVAKEKLTGTPEQKRLVKELKAKKKHKLTLLKDLQSKVKTDPAYVDCLSNINETYIAKAKEIYSTYSNQHDMFWGFLAIPRTKMPKTGFPKFKKYDQSGILGFQFQSQKKIPPLTWDRVMSGKDSRIKGKIVSYRSPIFENGKLVSYVEKQYCVLTLTCKKNKIDIPFFMDRPLPDDTVIKWCYLKREKIGTKGAWKIQFVVSKKTGFIEPTSNKDNCGVDINWSKLEDSLFVASVYGVFNNEEYYTELSIPLTEKSITEKFGRGTVEYYKKTRELKSISDIHLTEAIAKLSCWIKSIKDLGEFSVIDLPDWFVEKTKYIDKWKSPKHLKSLMSKWLYVNNRFEGDKDIIETLLGWLERHHHIYNWHSDQIRKFIKHRDNVYRTFIADLRAKFGTIFIEDIDLKSMKMLADATDDQKDATRIYRDIVSPGRFLELIMETGAFKKINPKNTSKTCHKCKKVTKLGSEQEYTCEYCNEHWNRQYNAARNIYSIGERSND